MRMEFRSDIGLMIVKVTDAPDPAQMASTREKAANIDKQTQLRAFVLDLREQTGSSLTGASARALLTQCDRTTGAMRGPDAPPLKLALLTAPGSFGQGIARMFLGHAYGLENLILRQFGSLQEAAPWLDLPEGWQDTCQAG